jgi:hypothetical protein
MEAVGEIAKWYTQGVCYDDSEVAVAHKLAEDGYMPLTVPLVDIRATAIELQLLGIVSDVEEVVNEFRDIHYTDRSWRCMEIMKPALATLLQANYVSQKRNDAAMAIMAAMQPPKDSDADVPSNTLNDYLLGLLTNDIRLAGNPRPWERVQTNSEAISFWLISEMANALGLKVDQEQIAKASNKCWKGLGVESPEQAEAWMKDASVNNEQFTKFAIRTALVDAAKDWLNSTSRGRDFVPITYEYELLTGKYKNSTMK